MHRRQFCLGVTAALAATAGCSGWRTDSTPGTEEDSETPSATETETVPETAPESSATIRGATETATETATDTPPEAFLPEPADEWEHVDTESYSWRYLGADGGTIGEYRGPDGASYEVVVMKSGESATRMACVGWQVALEIDEYMIAASTGTYDQELTPERPPTMTQTPVPGTEDRVLELLAMSPRLTEDEITENSADCPEWRLDREPVEETNRTTTSD